MNSQFSKLKRYSTYFILTRVVLFTENQYIIEENIRRNILSYTQHYSTKGYATIITCK